MNERIKQLLPVSDWHAVAASREGTTDEIIIEAVPLIAWAIIDGDDGHPECQSADWIAGVCILETQPIVCDGLQFREFSGRMFIGYCPEGQIEEREGYFREQAAIRLGMDAVKWKRIEEIAEQSTLTRG